MSTELLLFVLVVRICGDMPTGTGCRAIEAGTYVGENQCRQAARELGWAPRGAVKCVLRVVE